MNLRTAPPLNELRGGSGKTLFVNVIAENYADRIAFRKILRQSQGRGDAAFPFLIRVIEMLQSKFLAVAEEPKKISCAIASSHDQDFPDSRFHQSADRIVDHRPVIDRKQMLVCDFRQRRKAGSKSAGQYNTLHSRLL